MSQADSGLIMSILKERETFYVYMQEVGGSKLSLLCSAPVSHGTAYSVVSIASGIQSLT